MTEQPVSIRVAEGRDLRALCGLSGELGYPATLQALETRFNNLIETPENAVFVAEIESGEIVGWVHVFGAHRVESDAFAEIGGLVVAAGLRRRGVGGILLETSRRWAESRGYVKLRIRSRADRNGAHRFFESSGLSHRKTQEIFDAPLKRGDSED